MIIAFEECNTISFFLTNLQCVFIVNGPMGMNQTIRSGGLSEVKGRDTLQGRKWRHVAEIACAVVERAHAIHAFLLCLCLPHSSSREP